MQQPCHVSAKRAWGTGLRTAGLGLLPYALHETTSSLLKGLITAAAEEPPLGGQQPPRGLEAALWYALLVACHLLWGLFPVSCRYLQTRADPPLEPMRLGFLVAAIAAVGLFATYTLPVAIAQKCCRRRIGLEEVRGACTCVAILTVGAHGAMCASDSETAGNLAGLRTMSLLAMPGLFVHSDAGNTADGAAAGPDPCWARQHNCF